MLQALLTSISSAIEFMGNICILGIKAVDGTLGGADLQGPGGSAGTGSSNNPSNHTPVPAPLWRSTSGNRRSASGTLPEGPGTLLSVCVKVVADNLDDLVKLKPTQVDALPRDLVQQVFDELVASGKFSLDRLGLFNQLDLDSINLDAYAHQVHNEWVAGLSRCERLRSLDLSRCTRVSDQGMRCLGRHVRGLRHLALNQCTQMTDGALHHLSGLVQLTSLELQGCENLTGEALGYLAPLTGMRTLNLAQCNRVRGGMRHLACMSQSLTSLNLGWCIGLEDMELAHLCHLTALTNLVLSYTKITDVGMEALRPLVRLQTLDVQGCQITDRSCGVLAAFTSLTTLTLDNCRRIGDAGLEQLAGLGKLTQLCLAYTKITNQGMVTLKSFSQLSYLNLDSCQISDAGCKHLKVLSRLQNLNLADTEVQDGTLSHLSELTSLKRLQLAYTKVTDEGLANLRKLTNLEDLNLDSGSITSEGLVHISHLVSLTALDVYAARICDNGITRLTPLTSLQKLEMCGGGVSDAGCAHLAKLKDLTWLSLAHNPGVTDAGVRSLAASLPHLEALNLSHTQITSAALREVLRMTSLRALSLCYTRVPEGAVKALLARTNNSLRVKHSYRGHM